MTETEVRAWFAAVAATGDCTDAEEETAETVRTTGLHYKAEAVLRGYVLAA